MLDAGVVFKEEVDGARSFAPTTEPIRTHVGAPSLDACALGPPNLQRGVNHRPCCAEELAKLPGYEAVAAATGITTPVLFWLHSPRREQALHQRLARTRRAVPVATAAGDSVGADPSGVVWRRVGADSDARVSLADLAGEWT